MLKAIRMSEESYAQEQFVQKDIKEENSELHAMVTYLEENWTQVAKKVSEKEIEISEKDKIILELQEENMKVRESLIRLQQEFEQMVSAIDSIAKDNKRLKRCLGLREQAGIHNDVGLESSC